MISFSISCAITEKEEEEKRRALEAEEKRKEAEERERKLAEIEKKKLEKEREIEEKLRRTEQEARSRDVRAEPRDSKDTWRRKEPEDTWRRGGGPDTRMPSRDIGRDQPPTRGIELFTFYQQFVRCLKPKDFITSMNYLCTKSAPN